MNQSQVVEILKNPIIFARGLGYDLLVPSLHNDWIKLFMYSDHDCTLQAHRESYKTTCLIVAITLMMITMPDLNIFLVRKDEGAVVEIITAVSRNLMKPISQELALAIYGKEITLTVSNKTDIMTNLFNNQGAKENQLIGAGVKAFGITGKHFPRIFTDDIVTHVDRYSKAERTRTKLIYQELANILLSGGVIINTGTPWHKEDAFSMMPVPQRFTVDDTGLMTEAELNKRKSSMDFSLFSANYYLTHIGISGGLFEDATWGDWKVSATIGQIDASYGGSNTTAVTCFAQLPDGKLGGVGKIYTGHVQEHYEEIASFLRAFKCGTLHMEKNADKGYLEKDIRPYHRLTRLYSESMNKHLKISTYLKGRWNDIVWSYHTDPAYMEQILGYEEGVEPDDAPDSASSLIRELSRGKVKAVSAIMY